MLAFTRATAKWPIRITSAEWLTPLGMNLHTACSHANKVWRYSGEENKSKSSVICMFYFKSMGTDARMVNNMEALGLVYKITVALPLRDWQMMLRLVRSSCRVCVVVAIPCRRRAGWALK